MQAMLLQQKHLEVPQLVKREPPRSFLEAGWEDVGRKILCFCSFVNKVCAVYNNDLLVGIFEAIDIVPL